MLWESRCIIGNRATQTVSSVQLGSIPHIMGDEDVVTARKGVHIAHHPVRAMYDSKMVAQQLLGPTADDMDGSIVFEDLLDSTAIEEPVKESTPEKFFIL